MCQIPCSHWVDVAATARLNGEVKTFGACGETGKEADHVTNVASRLARLAKSGYEIEWGDAFLSLPAGVEQRTKFNTLRQAATQAA